MILLYNTHTYTPLLADDELTTLKTVDISQMVIPRMKRLLFLFATEDQSSIPGVAKSNPMLPMISHHCNRRIKRVDSIENGLGENIKKLLTVRISIILSRHYIGIFDFLS